MAKDKSRKHVSSMTLTQLQAEYERASGTRKTVLLKEINRRKKIKDNSTLAKFLKSIEKLEQTTISSEDLKKALAYRKFVAESKLAHEESLNGEVTKYVRRTK